jgi:hypothetical protein
MDVGRGPLAAPFAFTVGALENVLSTLAPKRLAEIPMVGSFAIDHISYPKPPAMEVAAEPISEYSSRPAHGSVRTKTCGGRQQTKPGPIIRRDGTRGALAKCSKNAPNPSGHKDFAQNRGPHRGHFVGQRRNTPSPLEEFGERQISHGRARRYLTRYAKIRSSRGLQKHLGPIALSSARILSRTR